MSANEKYNGWTNYATWRVNLEIVEDYINSLEWAYDYPTFNDEGELARHLEEMADDVITEYGEKTDGLAVDYARAFLSDVDWYDIAEHYIADFPQLIAPDSEPTDDDA